MTGRLILVAGGGDVGSAVAHQLFALGASVLLCERPRSSHARRGMAYTDALFDGSAILEGIEGRLLATVKEVQACWAKGAAIPIVTQPEETLLSENRFHVLIDATMRRHREPPDLRGRADFVIGLGPGFRPHDNCHVAIETRWGADLGAVLHDRPAADRAGGPRVLCGVGHERFVPAPCAGTWRTQAALGQPVTAGEVVGRIGAHALRAPLAGHLRGLSRDGVEVSIGQRLVEVDPRATPQIFGLGERPALIARGVVQALSGGQ